ncbi:unnamed protein product [Lampetra fluviatilis]
MTALQSPVAGSRRACCGRLRVDLGLACGAGRAVGLLAGLAEQWACWRGWPCVLGGGDGVEASCDSVSPARESRARAGCDRAASLFVAGRQAKEERDLDRSPHSARLSPARRGDGRRGPGARSRRRRRLRAEAVIRFGKEPHSPSLSLSLEAAADDGRRPRPCPRRGAAGR